MEIMSISISITLFILILVCEWLGHRVARRAAQKGDTPRTGTVEAAVLALLGLLLAFSFSVAQTRWEYRRDLVVTEANAISTAWLRLDLLPPDRQPELRDLFRSYTDERIGVVKSMPDAAAVQAHQNEALRLQSEIWSKTIAALREDSNPQAQILVIPALNEMMDLTTTRRIAGATHVPSLIVGLIFAVALLSGLVAGYGMSERRRLYRIHVTILAAVVAITVFVILDLENPRAGLIRLDVADQAMDMTRQAMR
jgi:hypothetical protein